MTGPQYPQQPQQPYGQPYPQPPRKKSKAWLLALLIPVAVCGLGGGCVALVANSGDEPTVVASGAAAPTPNSRNAIAPAGTEVRDGKFAFIVTSIDAPVPTVGTNQYMQQTAQGEYVQIHVTVTNIGTEARSFYGGSQKLTDEQGREFGNDSGAEMNVNPHLSTDINPGNQIDAILVFDVPAGAVPASLELHDSMFSGGAKVALR
ncbi:DUF4352 domain-containing protein [Nocardia australiensis]|uniref:DUF4352 domain-containing protein n=1 Tax=Nocardia australiensis TaxID=2887191 RepID=UPI001D148FD5|nr:DUF4352 domain-containing protein [Nocardia australiensis]